MKFNMDAKEADFLFDELESYMKTRVKARSIMFYPNRFQEVEQEFLRMNISINNDSLHGFIRGIEFTIIPLTVFLRSVDEARLNVILYKVLPEFESNFFNNR